MFSRRQLFRIAGIFGAGNVLRAADRGAVPTAAAPAGESDVYKSLGVRPLINGRGTITIIGGSIELPEVRAAKSLANQQHVQIDELMDAAGKRLAGLTGAEWGMVSAGCAAAISHATAACVAGGNPDLHVRIPNLAGFPRDEVIIPATSRNVYDAAIRAVGVRVIEADTPDELQLAIGPKTAMIYIFAGPRYDSGPMSTEAICRAAKAHNVPVLVDAAAEGLTIPNVHLQRGATLVAYSGGKYIRGPQSAGLLLGRKDLVQAAWVHSAPHHGYSRAMKVGREEVVGMVAAVESWVKRDHEAEWTHWVERCEYIAAQAGKIPGVTATVQREPGVDLSNRTPRVTLRWDARTLGTAGREVADMLYDGEPRIAVAGSTGQVGGQGADGESSLSLVSSMMSDGDEKIVAQRIVAVLSAKHTAKPVAAPVPAAANVSGRWNVDIQFKASRTTHTVHLQQNGNRVDGIHHGDFVTRDISGTLDGDTISLASAVTERHGDALNYRFTGNVTGEAMSGSLDLGEYLNATWTARRPASNRAD